MAPLIRTSRTRRRALALLVAATAIGGSAAGAVVAARSLGDTPPNVQASHGASSQPAPPAIPAAESGSVVSGLPFADPPIMSSPSSSLNVTLTANATPVAISGKTVNGRVYSASSGGVDYPPAFMPPVISVRQGQQLVVNLKNNLPEMTNLHTHGFFISPKGNEDDIYEELLPGGQLQHVYTNTNRLLPGTYWYHPHDHPLVEEQVFGGLSGFIEVQGLKSKLPKSLQGITEHYVGLKDFQVNSQNTIPYKDIDSDAPTTRTVNGLVNPVMTMQQGETQLWHVGNFSADIWYQLQAKGLKMWIIGRDGNPVRTPYLATTAELVSPPARRWDMLVQAPTAGTFTLQTVPYNTGPQGDNYPRTTLMTVNVTPGSSSVASIPKTFWGERNLLKSKVARRRRFVLSENSDGTKFFINGKPFPGAQLMNAQPQTGTVEEWTFVNMAGEEHPIHIHVNDMQLVSTNGIRPKYGADSWIDTIQVPAKSKKSGPGRVVVRMAFRTYTGPYVFHCHILAHEDNGMMNNVQVISPAQKNVTPPGN